MSAKQFPCIPSSALLIAYFGFGIGLFVWCIFYAGITNQVDAIPALCLIVLCITAFTLWAWPRSMRYVCIGAHEITCKAPFCEDISIEYKNCTVGMDYHLQNGNKVWWIYICYGKMSGYKARNSFNHINALPCQKGFIKIMYRDDVYDTLIDVLPKRQRISLETAKKVYIGVT